MRKIFIPVLTFLMLISFVSCNLDNNGILWTGVNRYPSDDKDRNFIGYSEKTGKLYYTTVDGLSEFDPSNESSNSERVLSSNDIFINNSPDIAWLTPEGDKIVYVDDYVEGYRNPKQDYWIYNLLLDEGEVALKKVTENIEGLEAGYGLIDTFVNGIDRYVVAQNGETIQLYTVSLNDETLAFTENGSKIDYYVDSLNGLIWSKKTNSDISDLEFNYMGKNVVFKSNDGRNDVVLKYDKDDENQGNQIKSVCVNKNTMVVLRYADDDTVYVYKGSTSDSQIALNYVGTITEDLPSIVPSFMSDDNQLYFLKYNSARSSELYIVNLDDYSANSYTTDVAGLRAEAFFLADNNVFILTKDKGVFRIDGTSVTPVPDLRRR